jgi:hypothetical protein
MTKDKAKLPAVRAGANYDVGYARPPKSSRFKPGTSGNPKGRPRGAKNKRPALNDERLKSIIIDEAYREITVRDGNRNVSVPMAQAVVRALAVNAAKGQHRAQRLFAEMLSSTERQNKAMADAWLSTAMDYKIEWDRELQRREALNITDLPPPLPHPDQVKIDMNTGTAWIEGPATKDQVAQLELWEGRHQAFTDELTDLREALAEEADDSVRTILETDIAQVEKTVGIIRELLGRIGY